MHKMQQLFIEGEVIAIGILNFLNFSPKVFRQLYLLLIWIDVPGKPR